MRRKKGILFPIKLENIPRQTNFSSLRRFPVSAASLKAINPRASRGTRAQGGLKWAHVYVIILAHVREGGSPGWRGPGPVVVSL